MRMLMRVSFPNEPFNTLVRQGTASQTMSKILEAIKPESVYFTDMDGLRTGILVVNMENASQIPSLAEPFFLNFNAQCRLHPVMTPQDLQSAGLAELGKKWG